jgi:hypothetical protein
MQVKAKREVLASQPRAEITAAPWLTLTHLRHGPLPN